MTPVSIICIAQLIVLLLALPSFAAENDAKNTSPRADGALEGQYDQSVSTESDNSNSSELSRSQDSLDSTEQGGTSGLVLKGQIQKLSKKSHSRLNSQDGKVDKSSNGALEARIDGSDAPDTKEEITREAASIAWNKWRNKVSRSIWAKFCTLLNGGDSILIGNSLLKLGNAPILRFPDNTRASYSCTIDREGRLLNAKIFRSSQNEKFDSLVLQSVLSIKGKSFLKFPQGSKRTEATLNLELFTTKHGRYNELEFGDVEHL